MLYVERPVGLWQLGSDVVHWTQVLGSVDFFTMLVVSEFAEQFFLVLQQLYLQCSTSDSRT